MSLLDRLRPKWQNTDPEVRAAAVRELEKSETELLEAVATHDPDVRVRRIAMKKIDAPRTLLSIAETETDEKLAAFARKRARHALVQIACDERDEAESRRALELLDAPEDVAAVAEKARFAGVREAAFGSLPDDGALAELVCKSHDPELRMRTLGRIQDPAALKSVVVATSGDVASSALARIADVATLESLYQHGALARSLRRQAQSQLEPLVPPDHPIHAARRRERAAALVDRAEAIAEAARAAELEAIEAVATDWAEAAAEGALDAALSERFRAAVGRAESSLAKLRAAPAVEPLDVREEAETEARKAIEEPSGSEIEPDSETRESAGADLVAPGVDGGAGEVSAGKAEPRHEPVESDPERERELISVLEQVEAIAATPPAAEGSEAASEDGRGDAKSWPKLRARWKSLAAIADDAQKARFEAARERLSSRAERERREKDAEAQATLQKLESCVSRMEALASSEDLRIRDADKEVREAQELLRDMGPLPRSVNRKKARRLLTTAREKLLKRAGDTREMEEWKRWANADVQEGLIRRAEALRELKDLPKVAKEMRAIHEEWRRAGTAPPQKAEELWTRYKTVRNELKLRCDEFFERQTEQRSRNLEKKLALCEKVEALQDSEDWNATADAIKELQAEWKAAGPAPTKSSEAVWKRFRAACDRFFERRKSHFDSLRKVRDENLEKKEALCARAEAMQDSTDWHRTVLEMKKLQAEWRDLGAVPRKKSDAVWKRFRAACDRFFDRYKRRDEVEAEERVAARETLIERLEALSAEQPDAPAQAGEIWAEWRKLGLLPRTHEELQRRLDEGIRKLVQAAPDAFEGTDLDPAVSRRKREKLVERLEGFVEEYARVSGAVKEPLEDLAQRLKDALASNTMSRGQARPPKKLDWNRAAEEVARQRASWLRAAPVPGDAGRALEQRFDAVYRQFQELRPPAASRSDGAAAGGGTSPA